MVQTYGIIKRFPFSLYPTTDMLPDTDEEPLGSNWERAQIDVSVESIQRVLGDRDDFFVGGDMLTYWKDDPEASSQVRGPDVFLIFGVKRYQNPDVWAIWDQNNQFPSLIIEFQSPTTREKDLGPKKDVYERTFKTQEYFCYDRYKDNLIGWRLEDGRYQPIDPDSRGWLWSEVLNVWFGRWVGQKADITADWLRCFWPNGDLVLDLEESQRALVEDANARAAMAGARAEEALTIAQAERARAEEEKLRADAAEAQLHAERERLAQLEARLRELEQP